MISHIDTGKFIALGNGVIIELLMREQMLLGLGNVWVQDTLLRSRAVPLAPHLKSDRGVLYPTFRLDRIEPLADGGVAVYTTACGISTLESAYEDEYNGIQALVREDAAVAEVEVVWLLRPETLPVRELTYTGFSYAWRITSPARRGSCRTA